MADDRFVHFSKDCQFLISDHSYFRTIVEDFSIDEEAFRFSLSVNGDFHSVFIIGSDDYPENLSFSCGTCSSDLRVQKATVQEAFQEILKAHNLPDPNSEAQQAARQCTQRSPIPPEEPLLVDDEIDDDEICGEENPEFQSHEIGRRLIEEMEEYRENFGHDSLSYVYIPGLETVDIRLLIGTDAIEETIRRAWSLPESPLVFQLTEVTIFDNCYRYGKKAPIITVSQENAEARLTGAQKQLEMIANRFCQENYRRNSSVAGNLLLGLRKRIAEKIEDLSSFCMICDRPNEFPMLMPSICTRDLCVFAYETLGLMADVGTIGTQLEVVILLHAMLKKAAYSARWPLILDPFPKIPDPKDSQKFLFSANCSQEAVWFQGTTINGLPNRQNVAVKVEQDISPLRDILDSLPCPQMLSSRADWTETVRKSHALAWRVIRWTISSNRTFLVKLNEENLVGFMKTKHQFLMLTDTPSKEHAFLEAKKKHGSIFLFHGSPMENWHRILRRGLVNASGTNFQMHGKAYGDGIYFSSCLAMSLGYSQSPFAVKTMAKKCPENAKEDEFETEKTHCCSDNGKLIDWNDQTACIAICEVINSDSLVSHSGIWTLKDPAHCCTRFLFVLQPGDCKQEQRPKSKKKNAPMRTLEEDVVLTDEKLTDQLRKIIEEYMPIKNIAKNSG